MLAYDTLDRPTHVKLPGGEVVATAYDKEGANTLTAGSTMLINDVGYNERGQLVFLGRTGSAPDTTLSYHAAAENLRLSGIANDDSGSLPNFTYDRVEDGGYDNVGNLTSFSDGSHTYTYSYDELNRLKSVAGSISRDYKYDLLVNFDMVTKGSKRPKIALSL